MIKNVTKYSIVTLATFFGIAASYLNSKAFGNSTPSNGLFDKVYADIPVSTPDNPVDPGCSGSGCSGGASA